MTDLCIILFFPHVLYNIHHMWSILLLIRNHSNVCFPWQPRATVIIAFWCKSPVYSVICIACASSSDECDSWIILKFPRGQPRARVQPEAQRTVADNGVGLWRSARKHSAQTCRMKSRKEARECASRRSAFLALLASSVTRSWKPCDSTSVANRTAFKTNIFDLKINLK